ncbi:hypothetical protein GQ42DRAFT_181037 [Ramicandelaber brevisporus]|nr:hypothetical protein GQ42DRAFT_181037 [Ramicandelaber brevisporus]
MYFDVEQRQQALADEIAAEKVLKHGQLRINRRKYYFVLYRGQMNQYINQKERRLKDIYTLSTCSAFELDQQVAVIKLSDGKEVRLEAESVQDAKEWLWALKSAKIPTSTKPRYAVDLPRPEFSQTGCGSSGSSSTSNIDRVVVIDKGYAVAKVSSFAHVDDVQKPFEMVENNKTDRIIYSGLLLKQNRLLRTWSNYHFELRIGSLSYYKAGNQVKALKRSDVTWVSDAIHGSTRYKNKCLMLVINEFRLLWIRPPEDTFEDWKHHLTAWISTPK